MDSFIQIHTSIYFREEDVHDVYIFTYLKFISDNQFPCHKSSVTADDSVLAADSICRLDVMI